MPGFVGISIIILSSVLKELVWTIVCGDLTTLWLFRFTHCSGIVPVSIHCFVDAVRSTFVFRSTWFIAVII